MGVCKCIHIYIYICTYKLYINIVQNNKIKKSKPIKVETFISKVIFN